MPPTSSTYTIKSGDTLSGIARANNTTIDALLKLNPSITNPNLIYAGGHLNLTPLAANAHSTALSARATPKQAADIATSFSSPNATTGSTGVPQNLGEILGVGTPTSPTAPIPVSSLSNNVDLGGILARATGGTTTGSDIAGLVSALSTTGNTDEVKRITDEIARLQESGANQGSDYTLALADAGVPDMQKQIADLSVQAAQMQGSLTAFDAETEAGLAKIGDQPIPLSLVQGQRAEYQKQRDLTRLAKASELSATAALIQAYSGNVDTATKLAQQAVTFKYQAVQSDIDAAKTQLDAAKEAFATSDAKFSSIVGAVLDLAKSNIAAQAENDSKVESYAVQAAVAGAPAEIISAMRASGDPVEAARIGAAFLKTTATGGVTGVDNGSSSTVFSQTQLNNGAATANVPIDTFKTYDKDTQNAFINGDIKGAKKSIDDAFAGKSSQDGTPATFDEVKTAIQDMGLPPVVEQYLIDYATNTQPQSSGPGFFGSIWNFLSPF